MKWSTVKLNKTIIMIAFIVPALLLTGYFLGRTGDESSSPQSEESPASNDSESERSDSKQNPQPESEASTVPSGATEVSEFRERKVAVNQLERYNNSLPPRSEEVAPAPNTDAGQERLKTAKAATRKRQKAQIRYLTRHPSVTRAWLKALSQQSDADPEMITELRDLLKPDQAERLQALLDANPELTSKDLSTKQVTIKYWKQNREKVISRLTELAGSTDWINL